MQPSPIDFRLHAEVNGDVFDMDGTGEGCGTEGTCDLHLTATPGFSVGFDPVSCPLLCSHPTSSYFSRPEVIGESFADLSGGAFAVMPSRVGMIFDGDGKKLLHLEVSSTVEMVDGILRSYHEMTGFSHLPRLTRNVITGDDYIIPAGPGRAVAAVSWSMITQTGDKLRGLCTIPYELRDRSAEIPVLARTVESLEVDWAGGREVSAWYRTSIRALTDISEIVPETARIS